MWRKKVEKLLPTARECMLAQQHAALFSEPFTVRRRSSLSHSFDSHSGRPLLYQHLRQPQEHGTSTIESAELAEKPNQKTIRFFYRFAPAAPSACVFFVFSFRQPSARYSVFWCRIVAFILRVPSRPLLPFWAEHDFFAFFFRAGTGNFVNNATRAFLEAVNYARSVRVGNSEPKWLIVSFFGVVEMSIQDPSNDHRRPPSSPRDRN